MGQHSAKPSPRGKVERKRRATDGNPDNEVTKPLPSLKAGLDALGKYANKPMRNPRTADFSKDLWGRRRKKKT